MPIYASAATLVVQEPFFGVLANASKAITAAATGHLRGNLEASLPPTLAAYVMTSVIVLLCLAIIATSARSALLTINPKASEMSQDAQACEEGRVFSGCEAGPLCMPQIVVHEEWSEGAASRPVRRSRSSAVSPV